MDYNRRKKYWKPKSTTPLKPIFVFLLVIFLLFYIFYLRNRNLIKTKGEEKKNVLGSTEIKTPKNTDELNQEIKNILRNKIGTYSVYFKDLTSFKEVAINEEMTVTGASVNKIAILAAIYHLADQKEIDLDQKVTIQDADIQDYGTGVLRYETPGSVYSVKTLARLMMEKSDNTAAYILANQIITVDKIQELINSWGLKQTDMVNNKTSNLDMFLLLSKMFKGDVAGQSLTPEMLGFMKDSDFEDRLPSLLPKEVKVYHKIGEEQNIIHDVGIIVLPDKKAYYLGVMSTDINDVGEAKKTIAQISRLTYNFEESQTN